MTYPPLAHTTVHTDPLVFAVFVIFTGAAVFAAGALFAGQSLLIAYIILGAVVGPYGLALLTDTATVESVGHIGIIFLLFLLGLNLHPQKLLRMLREAIVVTGASSIAFIIIGIVIAKAFGFGNLESVIIGACMMFSSTIIGLKLLPTTALHHRHLGEIIISVLLLQDLVALLLLLGVDALGRESLALTETFAITLAPIALAATAYAFERYCLIRIMQRFDTIQEYLFLLTIGWCLGIAQLGNAMGLSYEMGAFIAGVALARNPVSTFIAESLKPLRDFFLIMFFFSLGAGFDLTQLPDVALPAIFLALAMQLVKSPVFRLLLQREQEKRGVAMEASARLGQISEFALLISAMALASSVISERAAYTVQAATVLSFIISSYWIVARFPTPMAVNSRLRRD